MESIFKKYDDDKENDKIYLYVPYKDSDYVKNLRGKWDNLKKQWYIKYENKELIEKYGINKRIYFYIPYEFKQIAKDNNAQWDTTEKKWFVYNNDEKENILNKIKNFKK